jgi:hypothetical protein
LTTSPSRARFVSLTARRCCTAGTRRSSFQGNAILDAVEESEKTLGLVLKQADWPAEELLALLIDSGKITVADVDAIKTLDLTPEVDGNNWQVRDAATDAFRKRHGLS